MDLPTWDKPSFACLASRFVYGETITKNKLGMVEKAEHAASGLRLPSGARPHPRQFGPHRGTAGAVRQADGREGPHRCGEAKLKEYGFLYVTMDLSGYRMGSMNDVLKNKFT